MFDVPTASPAQRNVPVLSPLAERRWEQQQPEQRVAPEALLRCLAATLDEVDYGMLLLADGAQAVHVNHAARAELDERHPLQLLRGRELRARCTQDAALLQAALQNAARRGLRKLLTLGEGAQSVGVAVVPLEALGDGPAVTLVMLGKRQVCEELSVQGYARAHGLTPAETRVLVALCKGQRPDAAAAQLGVAISTVRTQIGMVRLKTGTESIRALVRQVSVLPPLMGVLGRESGVRRSPQSGELLPA